MGIIVDPGTGLVDGIDTAILAGATGIHARYSTIYNEFNGNIDAANVDDTEIALLAGAQTFTGNKTFSGTGDFSGGELTLPSGAVPSVDGAISINSQIPELYNTTTTNADVLHREDGYAENIFSSSVISLGLSTDVSFVDVDAVNAKLDFTVNVPGRYRIEFNFTHYMRLVSLVNGSLEVALKFTDGVNNSDAHTSAFVNNSGTSSIITNYVNLTGVFNFATTGLKSIKLQKKNNVVNNVSSNQIYSNITGERELVMRAYRISN